MDKPNRPRYHARDHEPGGADPITFPESGGSSNFYGYGDLETVIRAPGSLLAWYRFNYDDEHPTHDALDSSGNGRTLTYIENTAGTADGESWDSSHEVVRLAGAHAALGAGDDGVAYFGYNQAHNPGLDEGTWLSKTYPGAYFKEAAASGVINNWGSSKILTALGWIRVPSDRHTVINPTIIGSRTWQTVDFGAQGWAIRVNSTTGVIDFEGGAHGPGVLSSSAGILWDEWYLWAVTLDPTSHLWTMYLNGEVVGTMTNSAAPEDPDSHLWLGNDRGSLGNFPEGATSDNLFYGYQDEVALYNATLSQAEIQAIFAARGDGTGFGPTESHIFAGSNLTPFTVSSELGGGPSGEFADTGLELLSDGAGGTVWGTAAAGTTWFYGDGDPGTVAGSIDGDFYFDRVSGEIWQKVSGSWSDLGVTMKAEENKRILNVSWAGLIPVTIGQGIVWPIPPAPDGSTLVFTANIALARVESPGLTDTTLTIQRQSGGNVPFSTPTTLHAVTLSPGVYFQSDSGIAATVSSGDLVGLFFSNVGASNSPFALQLVGIET